VTVVDVEQGELRPMQRVIIRGHRITAVGRQDAVPLPPGAQVVDARSKYLIPGLWDMHVHTESDFPYPLLIANGVTGIRDAAADVPLDTMRHWRREILAGTRVGPPRQILSGVGINEARSCTRRDLREYWTYHVCVQAGDTADARQVVEELQAAGTDMLKLYNLSPAMYFPIAAAARRRGILDHSHPLARKRDRDPRLGHDLVRLATALMLMAERYALAQEGG
jgi:hypothetical protein